MTDQDKKLLVDLLKEGKISQEQFDKLYGIETDQEIECEIKPEKSHFLRKYFLLPMFAAGTILLYSSYGGLIMKSILDNYHKTEESTQSYQQKVYEKKEDIPNQKKFYNQQVEKQENKKKLEEHISRQKVGSLKEKILGKWYVAKEVDDKTKKIIRVYGNPDRKELNFLDNHIAIKTYVPFSDKTTYDEFEYKLKGSKIIVTYSNKTSETADIYFCKDTLVLDNKDIDMYLVRPQ